MSLNVCSDLKDQHKNLLTIVAVKTPLPPLESQRFILLKLLFENGQNDCVFCFSKSHFIPPSKKFVLFHGLDPQTCASLPNHIPSSLRAAQETKPNWVKQQYVRPQKSPVRVARSAPVCRYLTTKSILGRKTVTKELSLRTVWQLSLTPWRSIDARPYMCGSMFTQLSPNLTLETSF